MATTHNRAFPLSRVPFTLAGTLILVFFDAVSMLSASPVREALLGVARVLIIPSYAVWLGLSILGRAFGAGLPGVPAQLGVVITTLTGLLPYAAADWLLSRRRRSRATAA